MCAALDVCVCIWTIKLGWIIRIACQRIRAISIIAKWMLYKVESKLKSKILVNVQVNITRKRESCCAAYSNASIVLLAILPLQ